MKMTNLPWITTMVLMHVASISAADPRTNSWMTALSGRYARVYVTDAEKNNGNAAATWSRNTLSQSVPAYSGVQEVYHSANWVYIRTTGLGAHVMGPWYLNTNRTMVFPNVPVNQRAFYRIPRNPAVPATKTLTGGGVIGYFVDGVAMFDSRDAFYWNGTTDVSGGTGLWNRDAYVNEGVTFDPANAHQQNAGTYHYHANPIALRSLLGDHVSFNNATKTYFENATNLHHSPILGWVRDGFPVYGPYGFSDATNAASGVRRMISGYVPRYGLTNSGRVTLPAWAGRAYNRSTTLSSAEYGPAVSAAYPLGRYLEDNDYLGDLGSIQGVHFDLDEYNGRFCVTPEFPAGTYAYFVSISATGAPVFPYNIGRRFYGSPTGAAVTTLAESVTTNFVAVTSAPVVAAPTANPNNTVTLTWSTLEGGSYRIESTSDFTQWDARATNVATGVTAQWTTNRVNNSEFYRVRHLSSAAYDPVK